MVKEKSKEKGEEAEGAKVMGKSKVLYSGGSYKRYDDARARAELLTRHFSDKHRRYWVRREKDPNYPYHVVGTKMKRKNRLRRLARGIKKLAKKRKRTTMRHVAKKSKKRKSPLRFIPMHKHGHFKMHPKHIQHTKRRGKK